MPRSDVHFTHVNIPKYNELDTVKFHTIVRRQPVWLIIQPFSHKTVTSPSQTEGHFHSLNIRKNIFFLLRVLDKDLCLTVILSVKNWNPKQTSQCPYLKCAAPSSPATGARLLKRNP